MPGMDRVDPAGEPDPEPEAVLRRDAGGSESARASRSWWDEQAADYYAEHGAFLGDQDFLWGPEGLRESAAGLLGPLHGRRVLEIGCGGAQCSRWLAGQGASPVATDISGGQLGQAARLNARTGVAGSPLPAGAPAPPFLDQAVGPARPAPGGLP